MISKQGPDFDEVKQRACATCRSLYVHHVAFFIFVVGFSVTEEMAVLKSGLVLASLACWQVCCFFPSAQQVDVLQFLMSRALNLRILHLDVCM